MALTFNSYTGDGSTKTYIFGFVGPGTGYFRNSDISVSVNGVSVPFSLTGPNQATLTTAPALGSAVMIRRKMPYDKPYTDFVRGNNFGEDNMNKSFEQQLYLLQETMDGFKQKDYYEKQDLSLGTVFRIKDLANGIDPHDAVTVGQLGSSGEEAAAYAAAAKLSETNAASAASVAGAAASDALTSRNQAATSASEALTYSNAAMGSESSASISANTASSSSDIAIANANKAITSATNAETFATAAKASQDAAKLSETKSDMNQSSAFASMNSAFDSATAAASSATSISGLVPEINLSTVHRTSDGKNHGDVVLANTHRALTSGNPHAVTAADVNCLSKTNTTAFTPTANYHPATKLYVDTASGGSTSSAVSLIGLKTTVATEDKQVVTVFGATTVGDGAGGEFVWDSTSTLTDDGATVVAVTGVVTGRWKRIFGDEVDVKWFGAKGDGTTNDQPAIQKALDNYNKVYLSSGSYLVAAPLYMSRADMIFRGSFPGDSYTSQLLSNVNTPVIAISGSYNCSLVGIKIRDQGASGICINITGGENHDVLYCDIYTTHASRVDPHIYFKSSNTNIVNCVFNSYLNEAIYMVHVGREAGLIHINSKISNCYFGGKGNGVLVKATDGQPRPEGLLVTDCVFLCNKIHINLRDLLSGRITGNMFDQAGPYCIKIQPGMVGVSQVLIECNYIATAQQTTTGVGIGNEGSGDCSDISIVNNHICYCGFGIGFITGANNITIGHNQFSVIDQTCITLNKAKHCSVVGNTTRDCPGFSLSLTDGVDGGPFTIIANHLGSVKGVYFVKTTASYFTIQYNYGNVVNDPIGGSLPQPLSPTSSPTFQEIYSNGRYRGTAGGAGAYIQTRNAANAISFNKDAGGFKVYSEDVVVATLPPDFAGLPQALATTSSPTFGGLSINGNIVVSGTVDGVDVSSVGSSVTTLNSRVNQGVTTTSTPSFASVTSAGVIKAAGSMQAFGYNGLNGVGGAKLQATNGANAISFNWVGGTIQILVDGTLVKTL